MKHIRKILCLALCLLLMCSAALAQEEYNFLSPRETADEIIMLLNYCGEMFEDWQPFDAVLEEDDTRIIYGSADGLNTCVITYSEMGTGVGSVSIFSDINSAVMYVPSMMYELVYAFYGDDGSLYDWYNNEFADMALKLLEDGEPGVIRFPLMAGELSVEATFENGEPMIVHSLESDYGLMVG